MEPSSTTQVFIWFQNLIFVLIFPEISHTHEGFDEMRLQLKQRMDAYSDYGENQFFDALEDITDISDFDMNCLDNSASKCGSRGNNSISSSTPFDVWIQNPESVEARRSKFRTWLGLDVNNISGNTSEDSCDFEDEGVSITSTSCRSSSFESVSRSSMSCWPSDDPELCENSTPKENFVCGIDSTDGVMSNVVVDQFRDSGSDVSVMVKQRDCSSSTSCFGEELSPVKNSGVSCSVGSPKRVKKWWLSRLRGLTCVVEGGEEPCSCDSTARTRNQRVKVHLMKKQSKELSALYYGQNIQAHEGAILTMKFSPDGQFLASAGEDRIVRVWQVVEDDRLNKGDIPDMDPSCAYFIMNNLSELKSLRMCKEKNAKLKLTSDSACVILPPKVFRILEKPLHEFKGHTNEVLDLSWSKNNCLLSSSVDKTVRLWQIGLDHCLKVFPHNNYVTCVQFNPVNDDYFISGSIDGKVRIWEISGCKVVYWTEIKDIVTAVCYRPDGQGGIIGTITGSCRFYNIEDHQLQLDAQISLHNKKKSSGKRITGFQFFPQDPSKVMVSCADSQVRIIQGMNVIGRYKGLRSIGTYSSAFFTSDGKHIVSASEDNNVYMWKCTDEDYKDMSQIKKVKSCERFHSNASVALPWPGLRNERRGNRWQCGALNGSTQVRRSFFSPANYSRAQEFFLESHCPKGSALWPEETLIASSQTFSIQKTSMPKSEYKFLRTCQSRSESNAWGLVIVTAGWDGQIRSFHNYGLPVSQ